jgi:hypothetical protein
MANSARPPTLDELVKILRMARNFNLSKQDNGNINVRFTIDPKDCEKEEIHFWSVGSDFLKAMVDQLDKLQFFINLQEQISRPDEKGSYG